MQKRKTFPALMLLALPLLVTPLWAVAYDCSYTLINPPAYPGGIPQQNNLVAQGEGSLEITCDPAANPANPVPANGQVTITVTASPGSSGNFSARQLSAQGPAYNLYVNPARSSVWGDGMAGTAVFTHTFTFNLLTIGLPPMVGYGPPQSHSFPLYGSVRSSLDVRPRSYNDTVITTLSY